MTKEVLVSISGLQFEIEEDEAVEVISVGEYYCKNGKHYIIYEDMISDEKGEHELTKNTLKISNHQVDVMKKGSANVHMIFEENKKNMTYYNTPFGELLIGIYTTSISLTEQEDEILLQVEYVLDVNYNHVSDCVITIKISAKEQQKDLL